MSPGWRGLGGCIAMVPQAAAPVPSIGPLARYAGAPDRTHRATVCGARRMWTRELTVSGGWKSFARPHRERRARNDEPLEAGQGVRPARRTRLIRIAVDGGLRRASCRDARGSDAGRLRLSRVPTEPVLRQRAAGHNAANMALVAPMAVDRRCSIASTVAVRSGRQSAGGILKPRRAASPVPPTAGHERLTIVRGVDSHSGKRGARPLGWASAEPRQRQRSSAS